MVNGPNAARRSNIGIPEEGIRVASLNNPMRKNPAQIPNQPKCPRNAASQVFQAIARAIPRAANPVPRALRPEERARLKLKPAV